MAHFLSDVFYAGPFRYLMKSCTASAVDLSCSTVPPAGKHGSLQQLQRRPLWGSARYLAIMCSNYRLKLIKGQLPQHLLTPLALEKHTKTGKPQRSKLSLNHHIINIRVQTQKGWTSTSIATPCCQIFILSLKCLSGYGLSQFATESFVTYKQT